MANLIAFVTVTLTAGCGPDGASPAESSPTSGPASTVERAGSSTSTSVVTTTTEPEIEIPEGRLVVLPTQNREDPAKRQFQLKFVNGTEDRFDVAGVRFVWDGFTTPVSSRDSIIVGGQRIDFPVAFPGATCVGGGSIDDMPALEPAVAELTLEDGTVRRVPVYDKWHVARRLYLEDCERQFIETQVAIEWADLERTEFEGRPVTSGNLRLTRRAATGTVAVLGVSGTIPFVVEPASSTVVAPWLVLEAGEETADVPVRFVESRCDPHALAEAKQPFKFVGQIVIDEGPPLPYVVAPDESAWTPMRQTADEACVALGKVEFVGDE